MDSLLAEEVGCSLSPKTLEAALGVVQSWQDQQLNRKVDQPSAPVTETRFVVAHRPFHFPGCDSQIEFLQIRRQELVQFLDRHGKIGIAQESIITPGLEHAALNSTS